MVTFLVRTVLLLGLQCLVYGLVFHGTPVEIKACEATASIAARLASACGASVSREGNILISEKMDVLVTPECIGVLEAAVLVALALAVARPIRFRATMAVVGVVAALCINQVRLVTLVFGSTISFECFIGLDRWVWPSLQAVILFALVGAMSASRPRNRCATEQAHELGIRDG